MPTSPNTTAQDHQDKVPENMKELVEKLRGSLLERVRGLVLGSSLEARSTLSGVWVGGGLIVEQVTRFVRNMILTRLLAPELFGVMAIVLAVNTFFESVTDLGIDVAVIQNARSERQTYLNATWFLSFARALALYLLVFVAAPWGARFYGQPSLVMLTRVTFLSVLFRGAMSPGAYLARKKMDFKRLMFINQGAGICATVTVIVLALFIKSVWALAIGVTLEAGARCVFSFIFCPFWPRATMDKQSMRELYSFSRRMFGVPIMTFLFMRADVFVIGKVLPPLELGIYTMAAVLGQMAFSFFGNLISQVIDPAFAEIQTDHPRVRHLLLKTTSAIAVLALPAIAYITFYGGEILRVVYGSAYARAAVPFAVLFVVAMLRVLTVPLMGLYFMLGRPELNRVFTMVRTALMIVLIYPAVKSYGITGAAVTGLFAMTVSYALQVFRLRDIIGLDLGQYNRSLWTALPVCLAVALVWMAARGIGTLGPVAQAAIGAASCIVGYAVFLLPRLKEAVG